MVSSYASDFVSVFRNLLDVSSPLEANVFSFSPSETNDFGSSPSDGNIVRFEANINATTLSGGSRGGFFFSDLRAIVVIVSPSAGNIARAPPSEANIFGFSPAEANIAGSARK